LQCPKRAKEDLLQQCLKALQMKRDNHNWNVMYIDSQWASC
jgi:hypothetical protein